MACPVRAFEAATFGGAIAAPRARERSPLSTGAPTPLVDRWNRSSTPASAAKSPTAALSHEPGGVENAVGRASPPGTPRRSAAQACVHEPIASGSRR